MGHGMETQLVGHFEFAPPGHEFAPGQKYLSQLQANVSVPWRYRRSVEQADGSFVQSVFLLERDAAPVEFLRGRMRFSQGSFRFQQAICNV